jgi:CxxC motif-containing protein (DUF1111 family)
MRSVFSVGVCLAAVALAAVITLNDQVSSQDAVASAALQNAEGGPEPGAEAASTALVAIKDAETGFDGESNGFAEEFCADEGNLSHSPNSPRITPIRACSFDAGADEFDEKSDEEEGLGPVYNARGCGECHSNPILGGGTQVVERRAGFFSAPTGFIDHPGGSLIHDRALNPRDQETVIASKANVFTFRASQSVLGDGYVEAIGGPTLALIAALQPSSMRGQSVPVDVFEQPGATRTGRFGWKGQQASLVSFAADAYLNEMGVTSPLQPNENTSNGNPVGDDGVVDDDGRDVELFALFMRSTKAPPVDEELAASPDAVRGSALFNQVGCNVCHTRTIITDLPGTPINGGALIVSNALGARRIHPFGDFMLHDIGTGDGIVQNGGASTRNKVRTAPLWGLRARGRFMHDGLSQNVDDAINRHDNQAAASKKAFKSLSNADQQKVMTFLRSL